MSQPTVTFGPGYTLGVAIETNYVYQQQTNQNDANPQAGIAFNKTEKTREERVESGEFEL